jgi:hypothetical protein
MMAQLQDVRVISERNARTVSDTRGGTTDLIRHAEALNQELKGHGPQKAHRKANGSNGKA